MTEKLSDKILSATVVIAGLGYLVDFYDLYLFNITRTISLADMGLSGDALTSAGLFIANMQLAGLIAGAVFWGVLADKMGRKLGLFASIALYSFGSAITALVQGVDSYAAARFVTAVGLAGELGCGIALISEKLDAKNRGRGVMIFISLGFVGMLVAAALAEFMNWRHMYLLGGLCGFLLLIARMSLTESQLYFSAVRAKARGGFGILARNGRYLKTYIASILLMTPPVFCAQLFWTLSPEIGRAMNLDREIKANIMLGICYVAIIIGDFAAAYLSDKLQSRKRASLLFIGAGIVVFSAMMASGMSSGALFYAANALLAFFFSFWVVAGIWIAEQFGTNIRATVTTTVPNFARASAILMNLTFAHFKPMGAATVAAGIGTAVFAIAFISCIMLKDTYGRDLDYIEEGAGAI